VKFFVDSEQADDASIHITYFTLQICK